MTAEIILIIVSGIFSGAGIASLITAISKKKQLERERKAKKEDEESDDLKEWRADVNEKLKTQGEGMKFLLYSKIKDLGREYISQKEISFDDLNDFNTAHRIYHEGLKEDGKLDGLMEAVNKLPRKVS